MWTFKDWREHSRWAAEVLVLVTTGAFLLSVAMQSLIFSFWGLNFLQVAGPSDVLMGGLGVVTSLILPGVAFGLARTLRRFNLRPFVGSLLVISLFWTFLVLMAGGSRASVPMTGVSFLMPLVGWSSGLLFEIVGTGQFKKPDVVMFRVGLCVLSGFTAVAGPAALGLWGELSPAVGATFRGCPDPKLLWTGANATVLRCPSYHVVLKSGQPALFTPRDLESDHPRIEAKTRHPG